MRSTKTNIANKIGVGVKSLTNNILPPPVFFRFFCHAELVSASLPFGEGSVPMVIGMRRNDIYSHAELVSASLPYGKDSVPMVIGMRRNDVYCHAELVSASLSKRKDSVPMVIGMRRNDRFCCTDLKLRKVKTKYN